MNSKLLSRSLPSVEPNYLLKLPDHVFVNMALNLNVYDILSLEKTMAKLTDGKSTIISDVFAKMTHFRMVVRNRNRSNAKTAYAVLFRAGKALQRFEFVTLP